MEGEGSGGTEREQRTETDKEERRKASEPAAGTGETGGRAGKHHTPARTHRDTLFDQRKNASARAAASAPRPQQRLNPEPLTMVQRAALRGMQSPPCSPQRSAYRRGGSTLARAQASGQPTPGHALSNIVAVDDVQPPHRWQKTWPGPCDWVCGHQDQHANTMPDRATPRRPPCRPRARAPSATSPPPVEQPGLRPRHEAPRPQARTSTHDATYLG